MERRPTTSELLGAPVVPPALLTRALLATRRVLALAHRSTAPPSIRVLEAMLGPFDNRTLGLLVELDVPDRLDHRRTAEDLAAELGVDRDGLERLLRYAASRGFVGMDKRGRFSATGVTDVLRRTHRNSWRGWVTFAGSDWFWAALRHLDARVLEGRSGMEAAHGTDFFTFVTERQPEAGSAFADAMAAGAAVQALALERGLDWSGVRTVCDVGGGTGATLEYLLSGNEQLDGILFDLPAVVDAARPALTDGPLSGRCRVVGGSFFDAVPAGADRYLLLAIVHDWDDESACRLLSTTASALGERGRAVVVESVLSVRARDEFAQSSDLLMAALASGRERTRAQFEALFRGSGLRVTGQTVLPTGFTAFELARSG